MFCYGSGKCQMRTLPASLRATGGHVALLTQTQKVVAQKQGCQDLYGLRTESVQEDSLTGARAQFWCGFGGWVGAATGSRSLRWGCQQFKRLMASWVCAQEQWGSHRTGLRIVWGPCCSFIPSSLVLGFLERSLLRIHFLPKFRVVFAAAKNPDKYLPIPH